MTSTCISRVPQIKQPDRHLKFQYNVLHSNVDFYFNYSIFLTALRHSWLLCIPFEISPALRLSYFFLFHQVEWLLLDNGDMRSANEK